MNYNIKEVAGRIKELRDILEISIEEMAEKTGISVEDFTSFEKGEIDFSLSFFYKCAEILNVDLIEILTGDSPKLKTYSIVRAGQGLAIERREKFAYQHLAYLFKDKKCEPLVVSAPYSEDEQDKPIRLSSHDGQEFNFIISGSLKFVIGNHTEILNQGDCIYYNSSNLHGMIAVGGKDCEFLAVLL